MLGTLEDLERRVSALEEVRPADLRRLAETTHKLLDDARDRLSRLEVRLEGLSNAMALLTASQAEMRGELNAKIDAVDAKVNSVRNELKTDIAGLRRDMPGIVAEAMREVLRSHKG